MKIIQDQDWVMIHIRQQEKMFQELSDAKHFMQSFRALISGTAQLISYVVHTHGFKIILYIDQVYKIIGRDWRSKTNIRISIKHIFEQIINHYNQSSQNNIQLNKLLYIILLENNWRINFTSKKQLQLINYLLYTDSDSQYILRRVEYSKIFELTGIEIKKFKKEFNYTIIENQINTNSHYIISLSI